jgi:hypothetical protein
LSTFEAIGKIWHISKHFHGRAKEKFNTFQANKIKLYSKNHKQPHERCTLKSYALKNNAISHETVPVNGMSHQFEFD